MRLLNRRNNEPKRAIKPAPRRPRRLRWPAYVISAGLVLAALGASSVWIVKSGTMASARAGMEQSLSLTGVKLGFTVVAVDVEGRSRASGQAILDALGVARGTPIFDIDPAQAKKRLEQVPWIQSASVYRRLPDTLFISIVEQQPLAFWQRKGSLVLIDRGGAIIRTKDLGVFSRLPVLVGDDAPQRGAELMDLLATEPDLMPHVSAAVRVGERRWNLHFDNGVDVALPEDDPDSAWHRLAEIEKRDRILERDITMVDLRLPDRIFLHLPPEPPKSPPKKGQKMERTT